MPKSERETMLKALTFQIRFAIANFDDDILDDLLMNYTAIQTTPYLDRPQKYNSVRNRDLHQRVKTVHASSDQDFRRKLRVSKAEFQYLLQRIKRHPALRSTFGRPQATPKQQLTVALYRFGHEGNGTNAFEVAEDWNISEGSQLYFTERVIVAILDLEPEFSYWPDAMERRDIAARILHRYGLPDCVGFVDGCLIRLAYRPNRVDFADFYSFKHGYGMNIMAICDDLKRIRFNKPGMPGCCNDTRCWDTSSIGEHPESFFSEQEYVLGDSGYRPPRKHLVPLWCKAKHVKVLSKAETSFNAIASSARVTIEHTFGILKSRWQSMRGLRLSLRDVEDEARITSWIRTCIILHNMFISTGDLYLESTYEEDRLAPQALPPSPDDLIIPAKPQSQIKGTEDTRYRVMRYLGIPVVPRLTKAQRKKLASQASCAP